MCHIRLTAAHGRMSYCARQTIFIELMTSDRKLQASGKGCNHTGKCDGCSKWWDPPTDVAHTLQAAELDPKLGACYRSAHAPSPHGHREGWEPGGGTREAPACSARGLAPRHWEDPAPVEHMGAHKVLRSCSKGAAAGWTLLLARLAGYAWKARAGAGLGR